MNWIKKGLIYCPEGKNGFDVSHCHKPTPLLIDENTLRIYFGVRDGSGKTRTTFVDVDPKDPGKVIYVHDKPVLDLGKIGAFDDSGVNVCSLVRKDDQVYMYFIGWNPSTTVHTRNSIGLAVSNDNGLTFTRLYDGAVLDRSKDEPYYTGAVDVLFENGLWKMWYTSGTEWKMINGKPEIYYHIKYATSENGIDWVRNNISSIAPSTPLEATARPSVIKDVVDGKEIYRMWYSRRDLLDFRTDSKHDYRAGYAESTDGINWNRMDESIGIDVSPEGWDSLAIAYPYVIRLNGKLVMFYNGNGFGKTGFGYAVLED
jgi:predicted GH43/DUF377 family glycosyl hydrolase